MKISMHAYKSIYCFHSIWVQLNKTSDRKMFSILCKTFYISAFFNSLKFFLQQSVLSVFPSFFYSSYNFQVIIKKFSKQANFSISNKMKEAPQQKHCNNKKSNAIYKYDFSFGVCYFVVFFLLRLGAHIHFLLFV